MKKTISLILIMLGMIVVGCKEKVNYDEIASLLIKEVSIPLEVSDDFVLPDKVSYNDYETPLTWISKNESILKINDYEVEVINPEVNTKVKLVTYLNYEGEKREKEFEVLVTPKIIDANDILDLIELSQDTYYFDFNLQTEVNIDNETVKLSWQSSKPDVCQIEDDTAIIKRGNIDESVILTCSFIYLGNTYKKQFTINIPSSSYDIVDIEGIVAALNFNTYIENDFNLIKEFEYLGNKVLINWYSNDESIVKIDGNMALVSPNLYSSEVVIEAEITYLGNKANYGFKCIVVGSTYSFYFDDDIAYDPYLDVTVDYDEIYNTNLEVALYLVAFKDLPSNYVTKSEFDKSDYTTENKLSVGGDVFQNREGLLPKDDSYYECDILYAGGSRNALRLVYSLDTLSVYYTSDHYASFDYIYLNGNSSDSIFA